ncbi:bacillithiol biosynthesis cysteine-adding enzyme BshC [Mangrovivirga cuniculi]|uniref:bacillithiol biosynthesis cysteine-adding enzyme BshC n=1 Tax=Mangrovivirga cuniculi TaxID=2715131 RepID=UPI0021D3019D|nr:bacillithiol biosynthesis cysteine-adding enzyme BshC [Mangrovivirga cuniculi]
MKVEKIGFGEIDTFSPIFLDYLAEKDALKDFYNYSIQIDSFKEAINERSSFSDNHRQTLVKVLNEQYSSIDTPQAVTDNINSLADKNTFTVVTGHQLNIFTGPLYFIYKIVTTYKLAQKLKESYPDYNFVPVYWMASEDHDFAEINHFNLFGKQIKWDSDQTGPVGRFSTQGMVNNLNLNGMGDEIEAFLEFYKKKTLSQKLTFRLLIIFLEKTE